MGYTLKSAIDLSKVKDLKRDEPLLVAAVRGGRVLASHRIDLQAVKALDKVPVEIRFDLPPGEDPTGLELRVGPSVPEAIVPTYDALVVQPDLRAAKAGATLDVPAIQISNEIYLRWWRVCFSYTVTGRLVRRVVQGGTICNEPVPGATVDLYDVDRLFFWYRKTLITTTPTDVNGYFTATFRWCCWRGWLPPYLDWFIDYAQWERLQQILERLRHLMPRVPWPVNPNPPDPPSLLRLAHSLDAIVGPPANVDRAKGLVSADATGLERLNIAAPKSAAATLARPIPLSAEASRTVAELRAFYPSWWWSGSDCYPDLLVRATQIVGGVSTVIYDEPYSATRWDVHPLPSPHQVGTLLANDLAVSASTCGITPPEGDCFKFTDVGIVQVRSIGSITAGGPLAGYVTDSGADEPFGGTLRLFGAFGNLTTTVAASYVDYYKLQVAAWDGNPANLPPDAAFSDVPFDRLAPAVVRSYWGVVSGVEQWIGTPMGPDINGRYRTQESFEREFQAAHGGNPPGPWGWIWTAAQWIASVDTSYLTDGLKLVRMVGYRDLGGGNFAQRIMLDCTLADHPQVTELLPLHLDNRPLTDLTITGVQVNGAAQSSVTCQEVTLKQGDVVTISFHVNDPMNHLLSFSLGENHRLNCSMGLLNASLRQPPGSPTAPSSYGGFIALMGSAFRPNWAGGDYSVDLTVGAPPPAGAFCDDCGSGYFPFSGAYDVRLGAWKRVTNGDTLIFSNESNLVFVVKRSDAL